jgi:hypothetical protein
MMKPSTIWKTCIMVWPTHKMSMAPYRSTRQ